MKKKTVIILISCVAAISAAVTAVIIFHTQIADFLASVKAKLHRPAAEPEPEFTDEERESFADI